MKRRSLLLLLAGSACQPAPGPELGIGRALVAAARQSAQASDEQASWGLAELARLAQVARSEVAAAPGRLATDVLSQLLFERWGFVREVEDPSLGFIYLPSVLQKRRGSCVGLGTLFLAMASAIGVTARGVMMPGHFYVRAVERGQPRNVELLRAGEVMSDAWYAQRFPVPGGSAHEYGRPLSTAEVLGVVDYNLGNERRRLRRLSDARVAYQRAISAFPGLAEAHASLGAVEQLLGNLPEAAASYRRALEANPHLPGVHSNLALLASERGGGP